MKFLLDQGLPRSTVRQLKDLGIESKHVGDLGLERASDVEILNQARVRENVVVTLDSDFHALLALSYAVSPSMIRIRIEGLKALEVAHVNQ